MVVDSLQIIYTLEEYNLYKKWTRDRNKMPVRYKELAFLFALFKIKNNNHIQAVISGEFGQGKTSTAMCMAKWDAIYTRRLIKWYEKRGMAKDFDSLVIKETGKLIKSKNLQFKVDDNIIISPQDPASKYIYQPSKMRTYLIDDGYFFTSTRDANTTATNNIIKAIAGNRKQNPSMYWIFPNIFKIPTAILETMDIWIHKESVEKGDILIPSRVIQLKEKFSREKIELYARYPKAFKNLIKKHPSFITKAKFPRVKGRGYDKYLLKYEQYKWKDDSQNKEKQSARVEFFKQLEGMLEKNRTLQSGRAREEFIKDIILNTLKKRSRNPEQSSQIASSLTDQFIKWQEDRIADQLRKDMTDSIMGNKTLEIDQIAE